MLNSLNKKLNIWYFVVTGWAKKGGGAGLGENVGGAEVLIQTAPNRKIDFKLEIISGYHVYAGRHDDLIDNIYWYGDIYEKPDSSWTGGTGSTLTTDMDVSPSGIIRFWNSLCHSHWNYAMHFKYHIELKSSSTKITKDLEYEF